MKSSCACRRPTTRWNAPARWSRSRRSCLRCAASPGAWPPNCSRNGGALGSQAKESAAQELEAQAALLQSQLDYVQAADEMDAAIGRRPR